MSKCIRSINLCVYSVWAHFNLLNTRTSRTSYNSSNEKLVRTSCTSCNGVGFRTDHLHRSNDRARVSGHVRRPRSSDRCKWSVRKGQPLRSRLWNRPFAPIGRPRSRERSRPTTAVVRSVQMVGSKGPAYLHIQIYGNKHSDTIKLDSIK